MDDDTGVTPQQPTTNSRLNKILDRLDRLEEQQNDINDKLNTIITILDKDVKINCEKMSEHINFIDSVYENVKHPLGFLCSKLNILSSSQNTSFPPIDEGRHQRR